MTREKTNTIDVLDALGEFIDARLSMKLLSDSCSQRERELVEDRLIGAREQAQETLDDWIENKVDMNPD